MMNCRGAQVLRIADLSRTASRNNLAKADRATNLAKQARQSPPLSQHDTHLSAESCTYILQQGMHEASCDKSGRRCCIPECLQRSQLSLKLATPQHFL